MWHVALRAAVLAGVASRRARHSRAQTCRSCLRSKMTSIMRNCAGSATLLGTMTNGVVPDKVAITVGVDGRCSVQTPSQAHALGADFVERCTLLKDLQNAEGDHYVTLPTAVRLGDVVSLDKYVRSAWRRPACALLDDQLIWLVVCLCSAARSYAAPACQGPAGLPCS